MTDTTWHADGALLARYAGGTLPPPAAASVEAHLVACERCRQSIAGHVDATRIDALWDEVADAVDRPRPGPVERFLARVGVRGHVARLLAATPSLRLSWLGALVVTLALAVLAAHEGHAGSAFFLVAAPLLPLAGVAAAYGPAGDPAYEVVSASPVGAFHLLLVRATAVVATTVVVTGLAAVALPHGVAAAAWLLPALALTTASLALATFVRPLVAATALATTWVAVTTVGARLTARGGLRLADAVQHAAVFRAGGQLLCLAVTVTAVAVVAHRRDAVEIRSHS